MANLGFKLAMAEQAVSLVGDVCRRPVRARGDAPRRVHLGGEQSGHVVFAQHGTTGDGTLTAVQVMSRMASTGRSLADLASVMTRLPQLLINVQVADKSKADGSTELAEAIAKAEAALGSTGRVLVRPSGTEPIVRVMVEAADPRAAREAAEALAAVVATSLA